MSRLWQRICTYASRAISNQDNSQSHVQWAENRRSMKAHKAMHRLIDVQLNAREKGGKAPMPALSAIPHSRSAGWSRNRSLDNRVRKLVAEKLATGDSVGTDVYATSLENVCQLKSTGEKNSEAVYELTIEPSLLGTSAQVLRRTQAEIELHLLCESSFRLATGSSTRDDANDLLTLTELIPPRRSLGAQIAASLPKLTGAPSFPARRNARPQIDPFVLRPNAPRLSPTARTDRFTTASKSGVGKTATRAALTDSVVPRSANTSSEPHSVPQSLAAEKSAEARSPPIHGSQFDSVQSARSFHNPTTYSASAHNTNIKKVIQTVARSHTHLHISPAEFNCAWRCAWAMILTQQDSDAIEQKILELLGERFRPEAEALKHICEAVQQYGLDVILSKGRDSGRMVYRDNGPELENLLNRLAAEVLQKSGVAQSTVTNYFAPATMVSFEEIMPLVNAMGASCAVLQGSADFPSDTDTISFQPKNNWKIASLEITDKERIPAQNYVDALAGLPIAVITDNHFDLLLPKTLLRKR